MSIRSFSDDILRNEDVTPNSKGAKLAGVAPSKSGLDYNGIIKAIREGKIKALCILEDDIVNDTPELENILAKLDLLIISATNFNKTTVLADISISCSNIC